MTPPWRRRAPALPADTHAGEALGMFVQSDGITMAAFGGVGLRGDTPLRPAVTRSHRRDSPQPFSLRYWSGGKITFWRGPDRGETVDPVGKHYRVSGGEEFDSRPSIAHSAVLRRVSPAALEVAARHIDLYLTWGEPPEQVAEKNCRARELAAARGRELRFGSRLDVIVRDTVEEARRDAEKLVEYVTPEIAAEGQRVLAKIRIRRAEANARATAQRPG